MKIKSSITLSLSILISLTLSPNVSNGQITFDIHSGVTFPMGEWKATSTSYESYMADSKDGNASTGLNLGLQLVKPVSDLGFGIYASVDAYYNSIQKKQRKGYDDDLFEDIDSPSFKVGEFQSKHSRYFNFPASIGLHYHRKTTDENIMWHTSFGPLFDYFIITDYTYELDAVWTVSGNEQVQVGRRRERIYSSSTSLGFRFDFGITLKEKWILGLQYLSLGTHEYEFFEDRYNKYDDGEWTQPINDPQVFTGAKKISMLQFKIGLIL